MEGIKQEWGSGFPLFPRRGISPNGATVVHLSIHTSHDVVTIWEVTFVVGAGY